MVRVLALRAATKFPEARGAKSATRNVVVDFGLAMVYGEGYKPDEGCCVGTPQYISPESARGGSVSYKSDTWAIGIMALEVLLGRNPFALSEQEDPRLVLYRVVTMNLDTLIDGLPNASPDTKNALKWALLPDPDPREGAYLLNEFRILTGEKSGTYELK